MVISGHHIHALRWGPQASSNWSSRADIYDEKAMPGSGGATRCLRRDPSARAARGPRPGGAVPPAGSLPNEVVCHDMRKKVIPFPPRKADPSRPVTLGHSRITVQVGAQRYTLNIPCQGVALPPESVPPTKGRLEHLQVQTRFLHLLEPARLGDRIDGWRVCWVGGGDKCKLLVVMVERVVRAAQP